VNWEQYKATKPYRRSRVLAIILFGIIGGAEVHHTHVRWGQQGRSAFLAHQFEYQNRQFNKWMVHPHGVLFEIVATTCGLVLLFGLYELVAAGFFALLSAQTPKAG
jgi:hypothetical protein